MIKTVWVVTFIRNGTLYYEPVVFVDQIRAAAWLERWTLDHSHEDGDLMEVVQVELVE